MATLELTTRQIIRLIKQLPVVDKYAVLSVLNAELRQLQTISDAETSEWLEDPLVDELPPYVWGAKGTLEGRPVRYVRVAGL